MSYCAFLNNTIIPVVDLEISIVNQNNFILLNIIFGTPLQPPHAFSTKISLFLRNRGR